MGYYTTTIAGIEVTLHWSSGDYENISVDEAVHPIFDNFEPSDLFVKNAKGQLQSMEDWLLQKALEKLYEDGGPGRLDREHASEDRADAAREDAA